METYCATLFLCRIHSEQKARQTVSSNQNFSGTLLYAIYSFTQYKKIIKTPIIICRSRAKEFCVEFPLKCEEDMLRGEAPLENTVANERKRFNEISSPVCPLFCAASRRESCLNLENSFTRRDDAHFSSCIISLARNISSLNRRLCLAAKALVNNALLTVLTILIVSPSLFFLSPSRNNAN